MHSADRKEHVKRLREKRASRQGVYMQMSKNRLQNIHNDFRRNKLTYTTTRNTSHRIKWNERAIN